MTKTLATRLARLETVRQVAGPRRVFLAFSQDRAGDIAETERLQRESAFDPQSDMLIFVCPPAMDPATGRAA